MKKYIYILAVSFAAALLSCSKEQENPQENNSATINLQKITFTGLTDDGLTKTSLGENYSIYWSTSDAINVFSGESFSTNTRFQVSEEPSNPRVANFEGLAEVSTEYYALFPYQNDASITANGIISAELPKEQSSIAGSFGPAANLSVAHIINGEDLQFRNIGALVEINVQASDVTSLKLEALDNYSLSGKATISWSGEEPSVESFIEGNNYVQTSVDGAGRYYFIVYPGTYSGGFRITLEKEGYSYSIKSSKSLEIQRNENFLLATIPSSIPWFKAGDPLFIRNSAEANMQFTYITENYWNKDLVGAGDNATYDNQDYTYELFTRINSDSAFWFENNSGALFTLIKDGDNNLSVKRIKNSSQATYKVPTDGVYRIRINPVSGTAYLLKVGEVRYNIMYTSPATYQILTYSGNGVWQAENTRIFWGRSSWNTNNKETRYYFSMWFNGDHNSSTSSLPWQLYGEYNSYHNSHNESDYSQSDYYWIQPFYSEKKTENNWDWNRAYWLPDSGYYDFDDNGRYTSTITLQMNASSHYCHSFSTPVDGASTYAEAEGADLFIGGSGAESGQKFTWLSSNYYNDPTDKHKSFNPEEGATGYYEIYTKLEAGEQYYFYTNKNHYNPSFIDKAPSNGAGINVSNNGIYRIRVDLANKKVGLKEIKKLIIAYEWNRSDPNWQVELDYDAMGVWKTTGYEIKHHIYDSNPRYDFHMLFSDDFSNRQVWVANNTQSGHPDISPQSNFDLKPTETKEWPGSEFLFPNTVWDQTIIYTADLTVYFNTDLGHYTHTFTNPVQKNQ